MLHVLTGKGFIACGDGVGTEDDDFGICVSRSETVRFIAVGAMKGWDGPGSALKGPGLERACSSGARVGGPEGGLSSGSESSVL